MKKFTTTTFMIYLLFITCLIYCRQMGIRDRLNALEHLIIPQMDAGQIPDTSTSGTGKYTAITFDSPADSNARIMDSNLINKWLREDSTWTKRRDSLRNPHYTIQYYDSTWKPIKPKHYSPITITTSSSGVWTTTPGGAYKPKHQVDTIYHVVIILYQDPSHRNFIPTYDFMTHNQMTISGFTFTKAGKMWSLTGPSGKHYPIAWMLWPDSVFIEPHETHLLIYGEDAYDNYTRDSLYEAQGFWEMGDGSVFGDSISMRRVDSFRNWKSFPHKIKIHDTFSHHSHGESIYLDADGKPHSNY